jgi:hypothetical protein
LVTDRLLPDGPPHEFYFYVNDEYRAQFVQELEAAGVLVDAGPYEADPRLVMAYCRVAEDLFDDFAGWVEERAHQLGGAFDGAMPLEGGDVPKGLDAESIPRCPALDRFPLE